MPQGQDTLSVHLRQRLRILPRARFDLVFGSLSAFGGALAVALFFSPNVPAVVSGSFVFVWLLLLFSTVFFHTEKELEREAGKTEVEALEKKGEEAQRRQATGQRENAINLTAGVIDSATRILRAITEELREFARYRERSSEDYSRLKNRMLRHLFRDLRHLFEGDTRGVDTTTWPHNFFKIALFEPEPALLNAAKLRRTFYEYPEGIDPHPETEIVDLTQHERAALVLAFKQQNIVVIEDIKSEAKKPRSVRRWEDLRDDQSEGYESMVCAAIVSGVRNQPERKCLGVLVIDTDRERYFREDRSYQAFLGTLLNPFRTILTFILEVESYFIPFLPVYDALGDRSGSST